MAGRVHLCQVAGNTAWYGKWVTLRSSEMSFSLRAILYFNLSTFFKTREQFCPRLYNLSYMLCDDANVCVQRPVAKRHGWELFDVQRAHRSESRLYIWEAVPTAGLELDGKCLLRASYHARCSWRVPTLRHTVYRNVHARNDVQDVSYQPVLSRHRTYTLHDAPRRFQLSLDSFIIFINLFIDAFIYLFRPTHTFYTYINTFVLTYTLLYCIVHTYVPTYLLTYIHTYRVGVWLLQ